MKKRDKQKQSKLEKNATKRAQYEKARKGKKFVPKLPPSATSTTGE